MAVDPNAGRSQPGFSGPQDPTQTGDMVVVKSSTYRALLDVVVGPEGASWHLGKSDLIVPTDAFLNLTYMARIIEELVDEVNRMATQVHNLSDQLARVAREVDVPASPKQPAKSGPSAPAHPFITLEQ